MKKHSQGFTLVETLVAISILMLAILGPLTITSTGLKSAIYGRDQITAYYLAQEGIEYVRYTRDENYLNDRAWLFGLDSCLSTNNPPGCIIDIRRWFDAPYTGEITACSGASCTNNRLYLTPQNFFTHQTSGNTLSKYTRKVTIAPTGGSTTKEVTVTSTITWTAPSGQRTFSLSEQLFNIYND